MGCNSGRGTSRALLRRPSYTRARRSNTSGPGVRRCAWRWPRRRPFRTQDPWPSDNRLHRIVLVLEDVFHLLHVDLRLVIVDTDLLAGNVHADIANTFDGRQRVGDRALAMLAGDVRYVQSDVAHRGSFL